ncbi:MAG TPA: phage protein [Bryobacteraceae bacterium]|jgi:hypothetical protein|nr:phage protein [Bryobacteraceae bacterium]
MTTYSFKDLTGAFVHPLVGSYILAGGNVGLGQITITNATDRTAHDTAADGSVMVSYIAGDSGAATIEVQQTSDLHSFLLGWFNQLKTLADSGDVSLWAAGVLSLRNLEDGTVHTLTGVSPSKVPDKVYQAQGQRVTWNLMAAAVISE